MGVPERITRRFTSREFKAWNVSDSRCAEVLDKQTIEGKDTSSDTRILQAMSLVTKEKANLAVDQVGCQSSQCLIRDNHH